MRRQCHEIWINGCPRYQAPKLHISTTEKQMYAANSWWGFTMATDRQRVEAVIRWGVRSGLCHLYILTAVELTEDMDYKLFQRILWAKNHILHALLLNWSANLDLDVMIVNWISN